MYYTTTDQQECGNTNPIGINLPPAALNLSIILHQPYPHSMAARLSFFGCAGLDNRGRNRSLSSPQANTETADLRRGRKHHFCLRSILPTVVSSIPANPTQRLASTIGFPGS